MDDTDNYRKYRGKCKQFSEAACAADPTLTLVRGHYYCPIWNSNEQHWWTVRPDGSIYDPTVLQFPSKGLGTYTPFDGTVLCDNCGKIVPESKAIFSSRYAFCCNACYGQFVGVL